MSETDDAIALANRVLDKPGIGPDGDIAMLARQFLRAREGREAAYKAGVEFAAATAARERPPPTLDEVHKALVEQYDAMLEDMEAFTNKPHEAKTEDEIKRERAAMDRYEKAEREVMHLSYPLWRAQNLERSIATNAHADGRIRGFLPPWPRDDDAEAA